MERLPYACYDYEQWKTLVMADPSALLKSMSNDSVWLYDINRTTPGGLFGAVPTWIDPKDPIHLKDQIHRNYLHGGGWNEFEGFSVYVDYQGYLNIKYPGDPAYREIGRGMINHCGKIAVIAFFRHSWVAILGEDAWTAAVGPNPTIDNKHVNIARID